MEGGKGRLKFIRDMYPRKYTSRYGNELIERKLP